MLNLAKEKVIPFTRNIRPKEDQFCPCGNAKNPLENFGNLSSAFFPLPGKGSILSLHVPGFQEQILRSWSSSITIGNLTSLLSSIVFSVILCQILSNYQYNAFCSWAFIYSIQAISILSSNIYYAEKIINIFFQCHGFSRVKACLTR